MMQFPMEGLLKIDPASLGPVVRQGLADGTMEFASGSGNGGLQGTIRHATGSLKGRIVQHVDFIPVTPQDLAQPQQLLQLAAITASAAVVVGVVVVATAYLAGKIASVKQSVEALQGAVQQQDRRESLRMVTDYTAEIEMARELLTAKAASSAVGVSQDLIRARQRALQSVDGLCGLLNDPATAASEVDRSLELMVRLLDLVPSALMVERDVALLLGHADLVRSAPEVSIADYRRRLASFRVWCEEKYRRVALGHGGPAEVLRRQGPALRQLIESPINQFALASVENDAARAGGQSSDPAGAVQTLFAALAARGGSVG